MDRELPQHVVSSSVSKSATLTLSRLELTAITVRRLPCIRGAALLAVHHILSPSIVFLSPVCACERLQRSG
jgi:hypothetical protein